jgi:hypothetical protein
MASHLKIKKNQKKSKKNQKKSKKIKKKSKKSKNKKRFLKTPESDCHLTLAFQKNIKAARNVYLIKSQR